MTTEVFRRRVQHLLMQSDSVGKKSIRIESRIVRQTDWIVPSRIIHIYPPRLRTLERVGAEREKGQELVANRLLFSSSLCTVGFRGGLGIVFC